VVFQVFADKAVGAEVVFAFGLGFSRADKGRTFEGGGAAVFDAEAVVAREEAALPADGALLGIGDGVVLLDVFFPGVDAGVVAVDARDGVSAAAFFVDGFFVGGYAGFFVIDAKGGAGAVEDEAGEGEVVAVVVHGALRADGDKVARVAFQAFAEDLGAVEQGFAVADVGVALQTADVAQAVGGAVAVGFAFANVGVGDNAEAAAVRAQHDGDAAAATAAVLAAFDGFFHAVGSEGFFAFDGDAVATGKAGKQNRQHRYRP